MHISDKYLAQKNNIEPRMFNTYSVHLKTNLEDKQMVQPDCKAAKAI